MSCIVFNAHNYAHIWSAYEVRYLGSSASTIQWYGGVGRTTGILAFFIVQTHLHWSLDELQTEHSTMVLFRPTLFFFAIANFKSAVKIIWHSWNSEIEKTFWHCIAFRCFDSGWRSVWQWLIKHIYRYYTFYVVHWISFPWWIFFGYHYNSMAAHSNPLHFETLCVPVWNSSSKPNHLAWSWGWISTTTDTGATHHRYLLRMLWSWGGTSSNSSWRTTRSHVPSHPSKPTRFLVGYSWKCGSKHMERNHTNWGFWQTWCALEAEGL